MGREEDYYADFVDEDGQIQKAPKVASDTVETSEEKSKRTELLKQKLTETSAVAATNPLVESGNIRWYATDIRNLEGNFDVSQVADLQTTDLALLIDITSQAGLIKMLQKNLSKSKVRATNYFNIFVKKCDTMFKITSDILKFYSKCLSVIEGKYVEVAKRLGKWHAVNPIAFQPGIQNLVQGKQRSSSAQQGEIESMETDPDYQINDYCRKMNRLLFFSKKVSEELQHKAAGLKEELATAVRDISIEEKYSGLMNMIRSQFEEFLRNHNKAIKMLNSGRTHEMIAFGLAGGNLTHLESRLVHAMKETRQFLQDTVLRKVNSLNQQLGIKLAAHEEDLKLVLEEHGKLCKALFSDWKSDEHAASLIQTVRVQIDFLKGLRKSEVAYITQKLLLKEDSRIALSDIEDFFRYNLIKYPSIPQYVVLAALVSDKQEDSFVPNLVMMVDVSLECYLDSWSYRCAKTQIQVIERTVVQVREEGFTQRWSRGWRRGVKFTTAL